MLIRFEDISKSFGSKIVLDKVSFSIDEGEIFGLLGRSGSGKSTLLKVLLGAIVPDSGKVYYKEKDITADPEILKKIVGLTTQENSFYDKLTVWENMRYYARLFEAENKDMNSHIHSILTSVGLDDSRTALAEKLSGGMKRRLDFALSIVHDPKILILDEPTTGLDPILVRQFWEIVRKVAKKGKTVIVISHIFPEIKENCKRAGVLHKGKCEVLNLHEDTDLFKEFSKVVER